MPTPRIENCVRRIGAWPVLWFAVAFVTTLCSAATTQYQYDALGRLRAVTHANGNVTTYTLDAAGNRERVDELSPAAPPGSIYVPPVSYTGNYSVNWTAGGTVSTYELWESTTSNFATQTRVFVGDGLIASISGHGSGTYYYRVRGCNGSACTPYREGQNPTVVGPLAIPAVPDSIAVPTSGNGSYPLSWAAVNGPVTYYEVEECGTPDFSTSIWDVFLAMGTGFTLSNITNGTFYYRVRACNDAGCSAFKYAPNGISNVVAPGAPSLSAPATNSNGNVNVTWGAPTGVVTRYDLYVSSSASFSTQTLVLTGTATNVTDFGRPSGTWMRKRVRRLMWERVGILRSRQSLTRALKEFEQIERARSLRTPSRNFVTVALLIARAALWREESRGAHFRHDFPARDDERWRVHSIARKGAGISAGETIEFVAPMPL